VCVCARVALWSPVASRREDHVHEVMSSRVGFYISCIVRCIGLCHYYQGEHNNSEKPEKREETKD